MPAGGVIVIMVLVLLGAGVAVYLGRIAAKRRREEMAGLAGRLGFSFDPSMDRSHDDRYSQFAVFRHGHSRAAYNTLSGRTEINGREHPVVMGDFRYKVTRSTGKSTTTVTYRLSYVIVHLPYRGLPDLIIRHEGLFDKLGQALGFDDIDFEDAEFSRRFVVKCANKKFAYDVCHARMIEFLKGHAEGMPAIDMEGGAICLATDKRRWEPAEFEQRLAFVRAFVDLWPDYLLEQLDARAGVRERTA